MATWIQIIIVTIIAVAFISVIAATLWHLIEKALKVRNERKNKGDKKC
ncbi:hypothetical protein [Spiroplasma endosymbiont of Dilophus febrilis]